ncbi:TolC family protein [Zhouia sp. PK063]|uniref:TolC family protein n=1 Tax=Zhouia sp. PK063 TaxID=3373602 RepID=UPI0037BD6C43
MKHLFFILAFLGIFLSYAQETYSLEKCLAIAFKNNLDLKGAQLKAQSSRVTLQQSWGDVMPSANANYTIGINSGRSIDPYTNSYIDQKLTFSNAGVNLSLPLFNGFRLKNSIKQQKFNLKASEMEVEEAKQDLTIKVTLAYLQVLNDREALALHKSSLEVTQKQLSRLSVLYKDGKGNPADYTDMKGQVANNSIAVITAESNLKESTLTLFQLLGISMDTQVSFETVAMLTSFKPYAVSADEIYNEALQNLATFKAKAYREDAAQSALSVAKSGFLPEISAFGQLNTNYSSAAQLYNETGTMVVESGQFVNIDGQEYAVYANQSQYRSSDISYKDQFENNFSTSYGISVNIPLFNGFNAKHDVKLKKIALEESKIALEDTKRKYKQSVIMAYTDMESAYNTYKALKEQVNAYEASFRVNEIRFNNGVSNIVEYLISKNNLDTAKLNLSTAKYDYMLRTKVLDYYRGIF